MHASHFDSPGKILHGKLCCWQKVQIMLPSEGKLSRGDLRLLLVDSDMMLEL